MKRIRFLVIWLTVVAAISEAISYWFRFSFWFVFPVISCTILFNGLAAAIEDDQPGGFNNPDGTATPRYLYVVRWVVWTIGFIAVAISAVIFWFAAHT
jgi:hypothetical protein